ncbi:MAG: ECF transporter S component [Lachnospiraceae bacterium]|nr:ECF transporter S component [Lachnospiraceae bacterium]
MERVNAQKQEHNVVLFLTITALFTALTYLFTTFVNIRLPIASKGGLIHLGNVPLFLGAILFGRKVGMIAGAIGMGLFDLLSGWTLWTPFTLAIVGLMGYVMGWITEKDGRQNYFRYAAAIAASCIIKLAGYYLAETVIYGSLIAPAASIPGNLMQIGIAAIIVLPLVGPLNAVIRKTGLNASI